MLFDIDRAVGDIGGLTTPTEAQLNLLRFEPVTVELCEASIFRYTIVNAGYADEKVLDTALIKAAGSITADGVKAVSKGLGAGIGAILGIKVAGTTHTRAGHRQSAWFAGRLFARSAGRSRLR